MDEKIKAAPQQPPTLQSIMSENTKLLNECLDVSNVIYINLTSDNKIKNEEKEINCMMGQVMEQNKDLNNLLDILISIKSNMYC